MADSDDDATACSVDAPTVEIEPPTLRQALVAAVRAGQARLGWSIEQLAAAAGCDRKTVSRVLNGHRAPLGTVEVLLRVLGLEAEVATAIEDGTTDPGLDP